MNKIIYIIKAKYISSLKVLITFSDASEKTVDFSNFLKKSNLPDLKKFRTEKNFKKFKIKSGNLIWGDYEMIFPLRDLYNGQLLSDFEKSDLEFISVKKSS